MNKKYKLEPEGNMYRIIALRDIPRHGVEAGDKGGLVYGYHNLSHKGDCWIECNARVFNYAVVRDDAHVCDKARVCNNALVCGNTQVCDDAYVLGYIIITDNATIRDSAIVRGGHQSITKVGGTTVIGGTTRLSSGIWEATPKVIYGSKYNVIYNDEQIVIGCERHPLEWWEMHGLWVAEKYDFTPVIIEEYRGYLNIIKKEYVDG